MGRINEARMRHAQYYCDLAESLDQLYEEGGINIKKALDRFDLERVHIESAFEWLKLQAGVAAAQLLVRLVSSVTHTGQALRFHPRQRIRWLEAQRQAAKFTKDRIGEASALGNLGVTYKNIGRPREALPFLEERLEIAKELIDERGEARTLDNMGLVYSAMGEAERAVQHHELALTLARRISDKRLEGNALGNLGLVHSNMKEFEIACDYYNQRLVIARDPAVGDRRAEGNALGNLGIVYKNQGKMKEAFEHYGWALDIYREIGYQLGEAAVLGNIGTAYGELDDPRASEFLKESVFLARKIEFRFGEANALGNLADEYWKLGDGSTAIAHAEAALEILEGIGDPNATQIRDKLARWREGVKGDKI